MCKNMILYEYIPLTSKYALICKLTFCIQMNYEPLTSLTLVVIRTSIKDMFLNRNPCSTQHHTISVTLLIAHNYMFQLKNR
jgi:hypothetical protein